MMCNTGFKFRIKDMLFEPLENISITLFLLFHPLGYSIHLKNILEWIDYKERRLSLFNIENLK